MATKSNFEYRLREATRAYLRAYERMVGIKTEYTALGGADFVADLTSDLGTTGVTGIITSVGALETLMSQGHATNLYRAES